MYMPRQRGNVSLPNLQVLNAILYVAEHGCKWHELPRLFGNWHTIYTRINRWAKSGVLNRAFEQLQRQQIIRIKVEAVSLDSTSINVHPDGTGVLKKRSTIQRQVDHHNSSGCRRCQNSHNFRPITRACSRCTRGQATSSFTWTYQNAHLPADGPRLLVRPNSLIGTRSGIYSGHSAQIQRAITLGIRSRHVSQAK